MASLRELNNIGFTYPEEYDLAMSGVRTKRASRATVKYGEGLYAASTDDDETEPSTSATSVDEDDEAKKSPAEKPKPTIKVPAPKIGEQLVKLGDMVPKSSNTPKKSKNPKTPIPKTTTPTSRKRAAPSTPAPTPKTPKRAKTTGSISHHFAAIPTDQTPRAVKKGNKPKPKLPTPVSDSDHTNNTPKTPNSPNKASHTAEFRNVPVRFSVSDKTATDASDKLSPELLQQISSKLHKLSHREHKAEPTGKPLVWSESRRELCEALPYYHSYKGGGYTSDGIAHAFMFDSVAHARDYIDSTVIIARAGGGKTSDGKGGREQGKDQDGTSQVLALEANMQQFRPVAIIAGRDLSNISSKMEKRYQVLDWFKPTDIWCEKSSNGYVSVRYRFEKLRQKDSSWWTPLGEGEEIAEVKEHIDDLVPASSPCQSCGKVSLQVYLNGWMCLHPQCDEFWTLPDGTDPKEDSLRYDPRFLKRRTPWPHSSTPFPTKPPLPEIQQDIVGEDTEMDNVEELTKSIVCPKCGKCCFAKHWMYWSCTNKDCQHKFKLPMQNIPPSALRLPSHPISDCYAFAEDKWDAAIRMETSFVGNFRVQKYIMPGNIGYIAHFVANKTVVEENGGPDDMFTTLSNTDIGLERRKKLDTRITGENICDHFTLNFGYPYKFIASPDSKPFAEAPDCVRMAKSMMQWAVRELGIKEDDFNELMVLGYKTANKIGYHDDGEDGLGGTIATLSVGAPAEMKLRMHEKHYRGYTKAGFVDSLPPIPSSVEYLKQLAVHEEMQGLKEKDPKAYRARLKTLPSELGLLKDEKGKARPGPPEVLKLKLHHGDIVVMTGALIQSYFVHCVEPRGRRRFAFTCRNILEGHLKEDEKPGYGVEEDVIKYDGNKLPKPE